jgi:hypothetical protein
MLSSNQGDAHQRRRAKQSDQRLAFHSRHATRIAAEVRDAVVVELEEPSENVFSLDSSLKDKQKGEDVLCLRELSHCL